MTKSLYSKVKFNLGFTLAEVLITLGIIGIVAALTIPSLMKNWQNRQYVTGLQKAYTNIQQAFKLYMVDEQISSLGDSTLYNNLISFDDTSRQNAMDGFVKKYFKPMKICRADTSDSSCSRTIKYLNKSTEQSLFPSTNYNFYTKDGIEYSYLLNSSCAPDLSRIGSVKAICGTVSVDINGSSPPNRWGRDYFSLYINYDGSLFALYGALYSQYQTTDGSDWRAYTKYWENDTTMCSPRNTPLPDGVQGSCATAKVIDEGWKMTY